MWLKAIIAIGIGIITQFILTPFLYPMYTALDPIMKPHWFGPIIMFIIGNFGFVVFLAIAIYIWRGLQEQQIQQSQMY